MARPETHNADYFSHDKNMRNDPKLKALRRKYTEGYAVYCMILEVLTEASYFTIDLTPLKIELMAGDFDVDPQTLEQIIDYCVVIELLNKEENKICSCGLKKRLQPVLDHRNRSKEKYLAQKNKQDEVSASETTQSKVKESKVKYIKKEVVEEVTETAGIQENFEEERIAELSESLEFPENPKIPKIPIYVDEEEKLALIENLKSHSMFTLIQKQQSLKPQEVLKHFEIFFDTKLVLGELKGKSQSEVLKNFLYWIPSQMSRVKKTEGNGNTNNGTGNNYTRTNRTVAASADQKRADIEKLVSGMRGVLLGSELKQ